MNPASTSTTMKCFQLSCFHLHYFNFYQIAMSARQNGCFPIKWHHEFWLGLGSRHHSRLGAVVVNSNHILHPFYPSTIVQQPGLWPRHHDHDFTLPSKN